MKNAVLGKVKTRIAKDIGEQRALTIYVELLKETQRVCYQSQFSCSVYYSDFIDPLDGWFFADEKNNQLQSDNLGTRIKQALDQQFDSSARVLLIGTDCPKLTPDHLEAADQLLNQFDCVVGPTEDGGFYLLGLRNWDQKLLDNITWSTDTVRNELKHNLDRLGFAHMEIEPLFDVDYYDDYLKWKS